MQIHPYLSLAFGLHRSEDCPAKIAYLVGSGPDLGAPGAAEFISISRVWLLARAHVARQRIGTELARRAEAAANALGAHESQREAAHNGAVCNPFRRKNELAFALMSYSVCKGA